MPDKIKLRIWFWFKNFQANRAEIRTKVTKIASGSIDREWTKNAASKVKSRLAIVAIVRFLKISLAKKYVMMIEAVVNKTGMIRQPNGLSPKIFREAAKIILPKGDGGVIGWVSPKPCKMSRTAGRIKYFSLRNGSVG